MNFIQLKTARRLVVDTANNQLMVTTNCGIYILSLSTLETVHTIQQSHLTASLFAESSPIILFGNGKGYVTMFDSKHTKPVHVDRSHSGPILGIDMLKASPPIAVSGDQKGMILSWDLNFRCQSIYGYQTGPNEIFNQNEADFEMKCIEQLEDNKLLCKSGCSLTLFQLEPFGFTFARFNTALVSTGKLFKSEESSMKGSSLLLVSSAGLFIGLDAISATPTNFAVLPKDFRTMSLPANRTIPKILMEMTCVVDVNSCRLFSISPQGFVVEYDFSNTPGQICTGGVLDPPPSLGRIKVL